MNRPYQPEQVAEIQRRAEQLIELARAGGVVLTIELVPRKPLAMGNHTMVASAYPARQLEIPLGARP